MATSFKSSLPSSEVIQTHLKHLTDAAAALNKLSDALTKAVAQIETQLNSLNIGLEAWVTVWTWSDEHNSSGTWSLGYSKSETTKKWGFMIGSSLEDEGDPEPQCESWAFKDAPREERVKAVAKIPELLQALEQKAKEFGAEIIATINYAESIALNFGAKMPGGEK